MKISKISTYTLSSEVRKDFGYYIVKVETDSGIYGLGESGIWYWGVNWYAPTLYDWKRPD